MIFIVKWACDWFKCATLIIKAGEFQHDHFEKHQSNTDILKENSIQMKSLEITWINIIQIVKCLQGWCFPHQIPRYAWICWYWHLKTWFFSSNFLSLDFQFSLFRKIVSLKKKKITFTTRFVFQHFELDYNNDDNQR